MEQIYHPVSGEKGYFITPQEKTIIVALLEDSSSDARGEKHD